MPEVALLIDLPAKVQTESSGAWLEAGKTGMDGNADRKTNVSHPSPASGVRSSDSPNGDAGNNEVHTMQSAIFRA